MIYVSIEHVRNDQIMLIKDECTDLFYVVVESAQNYSFTPDFVSKPFKTKKVAMNNFNKTVTEYKERLL